MLITVRRFSIGAMAFAMKVTAQTSLQPIFGPQYNRSNRNMESGIMMALPMATAGKPIGFASVPPIEIQIADGKRSAQRIARKAIHPIDDMR